MAVSLQKKRFKLIADEVLGRTKRGIRGRKEQEKKQLKLLEKAIEDTFSDAGVRGGQAQDQFGQEGNIQGPGFGDSNF